MTSRRRWCPITAARYQASRNYPWKMRVDERARQQGVPRRARRQLVQLLPAAFPPTNTASPATSCPGRIDTATNQRTGYHDSYQDQKRYKPQVYVSLSYFKDGWAGSHDFKFGYDWKRDQIKFGRPQPGGNIFYRDLNSAVNELELYNSPNEPINEVLYNAFYLNDTWKVNNRLTLNLGIRFEHYVDRYPEQSFTPEGHAMLANWPATINPVERARYFGRDGAACRWRRRMWRAPSTSRRVPASPTT